MKRERGTTAVGGEPGSFRDELEVQMCLFSEWLELQGFMKEPTEPYLTHFDLARTFLGRS